jgi:acetyl-CoA synthetase
MFSDSCGAAPTVLSRIADLVSTYGDPEAGAADLLCDRHPPDSIALTILTHDGAATDVTFGQLRDESERIAAVLRTHGIQPGDRVATLMGKSTELVAVMLAAWRIGAVYVPLFTAFGPQAIASRLGDTRTALLVVDADQRGKLEPGPDMPAGPSWTTIVNGATPDGLSLQQQVAAIEPDRVPAFRGGGGFPLVHMLTSGTTGKPKGVVHPLRYVAGWVAYQEFALDVRPDDRFWSAADPGWAYGLYTAIVAPLATGIRSHLQLGNFSPAAALAVLADRGITNFAAAPTAFRAMASAAGGTGDVHLRCASSAGEPLTPDVNEWAPGALGTPVRDHYGQTELGMTLGNVHRAELRCPIKPGCMGQALPGWSMVVLADDRDEPAAPGVVGRLAVDVAASPLMTFEGYFPPVSDKFTSDHRYYLTGDAAEVDEDADFHFSSRDDDVIIMAGYRIGPFDIESVLVQHDAVRECAVIGVPDSARGEVIEAVVVLADRETGSSALAEELQLFVKQRYAAHAYPRHVTFVDALPRTPSGKVQRFTLREQRRQASRNAETHA